VAPSGFIREHLTANHDVSNFNSGEPSLDSWPKQHALSVSGRDFGRTYVWHPGDGRVVAFFTLSGCMIDRDELPEKRRKGEQIEIPSILLGKLALDISLQKLHLSEELIADAVIEAEKASNHAAARHLVVDALDQKLIRLYEKFGFTRTSELSDHKTRLFARIKDLAGR
jgi:predicted GNAT family N-acyltransferase